MKVGQPSPIPLFSALSEFVMPFAQRVGQNYGPVNGRCFACPATLSVAVVAERRSHCWCATETAVSPS